MGILLVVRLELGHQVPARLLVALDRTFSAVLDATRALVSARLSAGSFTRRNKIIDVEDDPLTLAAPQRRTMSGRSEGSCGWTFDDAQRTTAPHENSPQHRFTDEDLGARAGERAWLAGKRSTNCGGVHLRAPLLPSNARARSPRSETALRKADRTQDIRVPAEGEGRDGLRLRAARMDVASLAARL